jgi:hypothetical protein
MENQTNTEINKETIEIGKEGLMHLYETRKWTKFLSVLGFVFIGLMMLGMLFGMLAIGTRGFGFGIMFSLMMLLFIVVYFFPIYYLYKFSELSKLAIANKDDAMMTNALMYLKKHYQFIGILTIVILSIYLLFIIFAAVMGSMAAFM